VTREWLQSEIAAIERHPECNMSPTLAAFKLALAHLDQIESAKPKESAIAEKIRAIIGTEYANWHDATVMKKRDHWHVSATARILKEVVTDMLDDAHADGQASVLSEHRIASSDYAIIKIVEALGEGQ
jgi:hypothetical protein